MSDAIPPALTPARWASYRRLCEDIGGSPSTEMLGDHAETEHELAALALHGQDFGFTRTHAEALSRTCDNAERWLANTGLGQADGFAQLRQAREALALIRALLPP
jgi:hypothetical protein